MLPLPFILMVVGSALASACVPEAPKWNCSEQPQIDVEFSGVSITECDKSYSKTLFKSINSVSFTGVDKNKFYTLVMVDPDAPGSPAGQGWLHMIKSSIRGTDLTADGNLSGTDITPYVGPGPPKNSGTHRYFLYLYEEPAESPVMEDVTKRAKFDIQKFASEYSLCGPVAMNMFVTEY